MNSMRGRRRRQSMLFEALEPRALLTATTSDAYANIALTQSSTQIALSSYVRLASVVGNIDIELTDQQTPVSAANFLNYVDNSLYNNTFIHRSTKVGDPPGTDYEILQGGGYQAATNLTHVTTFSPIVNEFASSRPNAAGTISMARTTAVNSATSEWFLNVTTNTEFDDSNNYYAVFGHVVNDTISTVNAISALQRVNIGGAFSVMPVVNYSGGTVTLANLTTITSASRIPVTYQVQSSNPSVVSTSLNGSTLTLNQVAAGSSTITVVATDGSGNTFTDTFTTLVAGPNIQVVNNSNVLVDNTSTVNWGAVETKKLSEQIFTITNTGDQTLNITVPAITSGFIITSATTGGVFTATLAAGASTTLKVAILASEVGPGGAPLTQNGTLIINSNDPDTGSFDIALTGVVAKQEIAVTFNGTPLTTGQSTAVDLGTVVVNATSPLATFTISNPGIVPLTVTGNVVVNSYTISKTLKNITIAPGGSDTIVVSLSTATPGTQTTNLSIGYGGGFSAFVVPLTAQVLAPQVSAVESGNALNGTTSAVNFGDVAFGGSAQRTITVTNSGNSLLTVQTVSPPAGFSVVQPLPATLAAGASADLILAVDTSATGVKSGTLTIGSDAFNFPSFAVPLSADVIRGRINIASSGNVVTNGQSTPVNFGAFPQNATAQLTLTVSNTGLATLNLGAVTPSTGYSIVQALPSSLAIGQSADLILAVNTNTTGAKTGTVTIASDDDATPLFTVPVIATIQGGRINVTHEGALVQTGQVDPINFGVVALNANSQVTFTITNDSSAISPLNDIDVFVGPGFTIVQDLPSSLAIGQSADLIIAADTASNGLKTANLVITSNDELIPSFSVGMQADVSPGRLGVTVDSVAVSSGGTVNFGTAAAGQTISKTFVIKNTGATQLDITSVTPPAGYSITTALPASLAPQATANLVVQLDAVTGSGVQNGNLVIVSSDINNPNFAIALTATIFHTVILGVGGTTSVTYADTDGTTATFTYTGGGSITLGFTGGTITETTKGSRKTLVGTNLQLQSITLTSTTAKSKLVVATRGGDKSIDVGNIDGTGVMDAIRGKGIKLLGHLAIGGLRTLDVGTVQGNTINVGGGFGPLTLNVLHGVDETITASGGIKLLKALDWSDTNADNAITTPALTQMNITGGVNGATINATGAIGKIAVRGAAVNMHVNSGASILSFNAGSLSGSFIYAGAPISGTNPFPSHITNLPNIAAIGSVTVRSFTNSVIAAQLLGKLNLGTVITANNSTPHGVAGDSLTLFTGKTDAGKKLKYAKLSTAQVITEGDFQIRVL